MVWYKAHDSFCFCPSSASPKYVAHCKSGEKQKHDLYFHNLKIRTKITYRKSNPGTVVYLDIKYNLCGFMGNNHLFFRYEIEAEKDRERYTKEKKDYAQQQKFGDETSVSNATANHLHPQPVSDVEEEEDDSD